MYIHMSASTLAGYEYNVQVHTRAVPSGPKLSDEHAVREHECPAREPRLRPPTFPHNTRTLSLSLSISPKLSPIATSAPRRA